jgi:hypothetical protein
MTVPALRLDAVGGYVELASHLAQGAPGTRPRPVIDRARARISEDGLNRLVAPLSLTLQLGAGQAELEAEIGGFRITATLTATVGLTGRLLLEATGLRLGWLPVPSNLVSLALSRLQGQRGVYIVGPRSVELDLPELLNALPVALDVRLSQVRLEPGSLELHCVPRREAAV